MRYRFIYFFIFIITTSSCAKKNFFQSDAVYSQPKREKPTPIPAGYALVRVAPQYQRNFIHEFFWGQHYRDVWSQPVLLKVLDLNKVHGGLTTAEMGGGLQTTSLGLKDKNGRPFTLRTLDKDPSKALPPNLRNTFVANIMRDQTSAGNPFAAFTVPPLAEAAGLFHTNPELFYVPQNATCLGEYLPKFAGKVVMLEEKYNSKEALNKQFGEATDIIDSEELFKHRFTSHKHQIDQETFAKARLFDVLLQDWDRHEGQWNWAVYPQSKNGSVMYKAIPKDRDQTFYRYTDGLIPWITTRRLLVGSIKPLIHNIPDVAGLIYNSKFLDDRLLNELTLADWQKIGADMQKALNEEIIKKSLAQFPKEIYQIEGQKTYKNLKKRINALPAMAEEMYLLLARRVVIPGSDEREKYVVQRLNDNQTKVEVFALNAGNAQANNIVYKRILEHKHTKEIILHGLGGNDEFEISGTTRKGIKIIVNGGPGNDKIADNSQVAGTSKKTVVYDTKSGNDLKLGAESQNKTSDDAKILAFERFPE